jgi:hypothetical protein
MSYRIDNWQLNNSKKKKITKIKIPRSWGLPRQLFAKAEFRMCRRKLRSRIERHPEQKEAKHYFLLKDILNNLNTFLLSF